MIDQSIRPLERWSSSPGIVVRPGPFIWHRTTRSRGWHPPPEALFERERRGDREVVVAVGGGDLDAERQALRVEPERHLRDREAEQVEHGRGGEDPGAADRAAVLGRDPRGWTPASSSSWLSVVSAPSPSAAM